MAEIETILETLQKALDNAEIDGTIYAEIRRPVVFYLINLLKSAKPKQEKALLDYQSWHYVCGDCEKPIDIQDNFCRHCGRPIEHFSNAHPTQK